MRRLTTRLLLLGLLGCPLSVAAQATCMEDPGGGGTGELCLNALIAQRGADAVVDDIFTTSDGRYAPELNFATYVRGVNGCIGWTGWSLPPDAASSTLAWVTPDHYQPQRREFLDQYHCHTAAPGEDIAPYANSLDWLWTQVIRTVDGAQVVDGDPNPASYNPVTGRIYDLGGEANRVVVFPISDHGPLPCESFEYTVWLSNDPDATTIAPESAPDPNQWNLARLVRVFRHGWTDNTEAVGAGDRDRPDLGTFLRTESGAGPAEADSLVTVWALPCGITFRYAAMQGGNNGNPSAECAFHSNEDELDAIAGLNEDDTAICLDADGDGHRDAACGGSDCDDTNPDIHPGAFERCDAETDVDCEAMRACPEGTVCDGGSGLCVARCFEGGCGDGFECLGEQCVEAACAAREEPCPSGTLCRAGECVGPCDGVVCPDGQRCEGGACLDPCQGVVCPSNQVCIARDPAALTLCGPSCTCDELATPLCPEGTACESRADSPDRGRCVDPGCETAECGPGEVCRVGGCVDGCDGVMCPRDQVCRMGACIDDLCAAVACPGTQVCRDGECFDACDGVDCGTEQICRDGACIPDPCFGVDCALGERCVAGSCVPDGTSADAGRVDMDGGVGADAGGGGVEDGGCGCRTVAGSTPRGFAFAVLAVLGLVMRRRRR